MLIPICNAKLHNVTVTEANPNYTGSISICPALILAAGLLPGQMVKINNGANGDSWDTYVMVGEKGQICLNGMPPSHHFKPGDVVIILSYVQVTREEYDRCTLQVVLVNQENAITETRPISLLAEAEKVYA